MEARGWDELDILLVSGDAYIDHPAFGPVLIARFLGVGARYRVGIVAQPRWDSIDDIARMGKPRLYVGVSAGNLDSMLNKPHRAEEGARRGSVLPSRGKLDLRPNRASIVYANLAKQAFPRTAVDSRRDRGVAPANCPLRLLVRPSSSLDPARR